MTLGTVMIMASLLCGALTIIKALIDLRSLRPSIEMGHDEEAISRKRAANMVVIAAAAVLPVLTLVAVTYFMGDQADIQLF